ncbi:MAG TPA: MATE family efflux transporter, partial [Herpetosiphonaceae bacterium]|nr:MATE family efflux transporter [Herpetosiphonaceae bacterium]
FRPGRAYRIKAADFIPRWPIIREVLAIGSPSLLKQASAGVIVIVTNHLLRQLGGDAALGTFAIVSRLYWGLSMPQAGVVQGMQPLVGYNVGQHNVERVRTAIRLALVVAAAYGTLICGICLLFPAGLIAGMSPDPALLAEGPAVLRLVALAAPLASVGMITAAAFQSIGRARAAFGLALGGSILAKLPVLLIAASLFGLPGIWAAEAISELLVCVVAGVMLRRLQRTLPA